MAPTIHTIAQKGFGTGTNQLYDRSLSVIQFYIIANSTYPYMTHVVPGPPTNHLYWILSSAPLNQSHSSTSQSEHTLDFFLYLLMLSRIGSGTGIFTRALLAHIQWNAAIKQIKAVEPSEGMRSVFSQRNNDDRVTVAEGTFSATGIADGWADLVFIAQVCGFSFSCSCSQFHRRPIIGVPIMKQLLQSSLVFSSPMAMLFIFGI